MSAHHITPEELAMCRHRATEFAKILFASYINEEVVITGNAVPQPSQDLKRIAEASVALARLMQGVESGTA